MQHLIHRGPDALVTYAPRTGIAAPIAVNENPILEPDAPTIWFSFPGAWHDIGRFHLADGTFTGIYTNVLTPIRFLAPRIWETTDLFLDIWQGVGADPVVLDESEFSAARERGWIDAETAARARHEADRVLDAARHGAWPPPVVDAWPLARVRHSGRDVV